MHGCCDVHVEVRGQLWSEFFPSTVGVGMDLKLSGSCGQHFYLLIHLASHQDKFCRLIMPVVIGA